MIKILFVCHGNICRSPMAEFILKDLVKKQGLSGQFEIASVATTSEEIGNPVYPPARRELAKHGIGCAGKTARKITARDVAYYDRIYYMDGENRRHLAKLFPKDLDRFQPLLSRDVADPWYTGDFSATWSDLVEGCGKILEALT